MVATFGEMMLRLTPPGGDRLLQAKSFDLCFGGAEANVAVSLSCLGEKAKFVTYLPEHEIGTACIGELARWGVDFSDIKTAPGRMGLYYYETGASLRPAKVIYDRADSVFAKAKPEEYDWDRILDGASWLHYTGITPALSPNAMRSTTDALRKAKEKGIFVSCDLNYRSKLWTPKQAESAMKELLKYTDMLITNEEHASMVFGIGTDLHNEIGYEMLARELCERFELQKAAVTGRETITTERNNFSALYFDGTASYFVKRNKVEIVERIGGGDAFSAGLIYSIRNGFQGQGAVDFAAAALCLKHATKGDFNIASADEVMALMEGHSTGRVSR